jgi:hypothetical protein
MFKIKHILFILFLTFQIFSAQTETACSSKLPKCSVSNFILGVQSNIPGIKKCCIYFAGKYRVEEAVQILIEEFNRPGEGEYKPLIVWSLYRIGDEACIKKLRSILASETREEIKLFCSTLLTIQEYGAELEKPHL